MKHRVYSKRTIFISQLFSAIIFPFFTILNFFRRNYDLNEIEVKTVLVTEYHRIGDVLIIEPILKSIKIKYPQAHLILVCSHDVKELALELRLADEVIPIDVPWTNWSWSFLDWWRARTIAKELVNKEIDLAFDFKGDIRNGWFLWLAHPKISFGYDTTGGDYFFTKPMKMDQSVHQRYRALDLISRVGCRLIEGDDKKTVFNNDGAIVIHPGSTDRKRAWPLKHWIDLIERLSNRAKIVIVDINDSKELIAHVKDLNIEVFEGTLVEFKSWLANQKCLVAPDSMAGHLAAYLNIPVITLFGSQAPDLTSPITKRGIVIKPDKQCSHKRTHWRLCEKCMASISPATVNEVIEKYIIEQNI